MVRLRHVAVVAVLVLAASGGLTGTWEQGAWMPTGVARADGGQQDPCAVVNPNGNVTVYPEQCIHD